MFSDTQTTYLRGLVTDMRDQGYLYYLAYQQYNSGYSNNDPDLIVYFSKDEIFADSLYKYTIMRDSVKYSVRTGNAYSSDQLQRVQVETVELAQIDLSVPIYNHISTNATFLTGSVRQPDLIPEVKGYETTGAICLVLCAFLLFSSFIHLFRR